MPRVLYLGARHYDSRFESSLRHLGSIDKYFNHALYCPDTVRSGKRKLRSDSCTCHAIADSWRFRESTQDLVEQWIVATGIDQLAVEQARWCLEQSLPQNAERNTFTAVWTGRLSPPRAGQYTFSVSPININKSGPPLETVKHSIKVLVSDQLLVDANPIEWKSIGTPIQLEADRPVPLRVELSYSSTDGTFGDSPHAFFFWEGPGIEKQIVPPDVLTSGEGDDKGLQSEYRWNDAGQEHVAVQRDQNIEFAWATCRDLAPRNPELATELTKRLWQLAVDPAYLASKLVDPPPPQAHVYFRNYTSTEFLSIAQRRQFLQILQQNPRLLKRPTKPRFYAYIIHFVLATNKQRY